MADDHPPLAWGSALGAARSVDRQALNGLLAASGL